MMPSQVPETTVDVHTPTGRATKRQAAQLPSRSVKSLLSTRPGSLYRDECLQDKAPGGPTYRSPALRRQLGRYGRSEGAAQRNIACYLLFVSRTRDWSALMAPIDAHKRAIHLTQVAVSGRVEGPPRLWTVSRIDKLPPQPFHNICPAHCGGIGTGN